MDDIGDNIRGKAELALLTTRQMATADRIAIAQGAPGIELMERAGHAAQTGVVLGPCRRHGAQDPDAGGDHDPGRADPGEEGDLGVPLLDWEGRTEHEAVAGRGPVGAEFAGGLDLLLRALEGDASARDLALLAQRPDLAEELGQVGGDGLGQATGGLGLEAVPGLPLAVGDTVEITPGGRTATVRGLQIHGRPVGRAEPGRRTAVPVCLRPGG